MPEDASLLDRLALGFAKRDEKKFWDDKSVQALHVEGHEMVPNLLRQIRLGFDGAEWAKAGARVLTALSPKYRDRYAPHVQLEFRAVLKGLHALLHRTFGFNNGEVVHIGGFVARSDGKLERAFGLRHPERDEELVTAELADRRSIRVSDLERPQGAVGRAFAENVSAEVDWRSPHLNANFTDDMKQDWGADQSFRSLLCVPVNGSYGDDSWVPMGVVYLSSSRSPAFWSHLSPADYDELQTLLRNTFDAVFFE